MHAAVHSSITYGWQLVEKSKFNMQNPQVASFGILYVEGHVAQIWISFQEDRMILENVNFLKALQSVSTRS